MGKAVKRKIVWITRDAKSADDSDKLFLHGVEPELEDGMWNNEAGEAVVIPKLLYGEKRKLRLTE